MSIDKSKLYETRTIILDTSEFTKSDTTTIIRFNLTNRTQATLYIPNIQAAWVGERQLTVTVSQEDTGFCMPP